jgi:uncharacterized membrane protein (UPF0127 family)
VACSSPVQGGDALSSTTTSATTATSPTTTSVAATSTTPPSLATGDLSDPEVQEVAVDGESLLVAWADDPATRSRGLMEVDDLGDLEGMLFDLGAERATSFTMRNTLIPLDIYFFGSDGGGVGMLEMVPCEGEPCPSYSIDVAFRYALEVPAGTLDVGPTPDLRLP